MKTLLTADIASQLTLRARHDINPCGKLHRQQSTPSTSGSHSARPHAALPTKATSILPEHQITSKGWGARRHRRTRGGLLPRASCRSRSCSQTRGWKKSNRRTPRGSPPPTRRLCFVAAADRGDVRLCAQLRRARRLPLSARGGADNTPRIKEVGAAAARAARLAAGRARLATAEDAGAEDTPTSEYLRHERPGGRRR